MARDRWARLALNFFRHPKSRAIGKDGRELLLASICWSAQELTDGFIPAAQLALLAAEAEVKPSTSRTLVDHGAWTPVDGGWLIHDYSDWQQTKAQVEAERAKWRRQKRGGSTDSSAVESAGTPPHEHEHEHENCLNSLQQLAVVTGPLPPAAAEAVEIFVAYRTSVVKPDRPDRFAQKVRRETTAEHWLALSSGANEGRSARWLAQHVIGITESAAIEGDHARRRTA